jgi:hypothetical protein
VLVIRSAALVFIVAVVAMVNFLSPVLS